MSGPRRLINSHRCYLLSTDCIQAAVLGLRGDIQVSRMLCLPSRVYKPAGGWGGALEMGAHQVSGGGDTFHSRTTDKMVGQG